MVGKTSERRLYLLWYLGSVLSFLFGVVLYPVAVLVWIYLKLKGELS